MTQKQMYERYRGKPLGYYDPLSDGTEDMDVFKAAACAYKDLSDVNDGIAKKAFRVSVDDLKDLSRLVDGKFAYNLVFENFVYFLMGGAKHETGRL